MKKKTKDKKALPPPLFGNKDLDDYLNTMDLNGGIVRIDDYICEYLYADVDKSIQHLVRSGKKQITFKIMSPGGNAYHGLAFYDMIRNVSKNGVKTVGIVEGIAASAASMMVLQAMDERLAMPNARILIHEPRRWVTFSEERASSMKDETDEMYALMEAVYKIMSDRTGLSKKDLIKLMERREKWMSAREAKELNLIDDIVDKWSIDSKI